MSKAVVIPKKITDQVKFVQDEWAKGNNVLIVNGRQWGQTMTKRMLLMQDAEIVEQKLLPPINPTTNE